MKRILGVDPGSRVTGYGMIAVDRRRITSETHGTIAAPSGDLAVRLLAVGEGLEAIVREHRPDALVVEQAFYARSVRTTLVLGHVRGVALWIAARAGLPVFEFAPRAVKLSVTGRGAASKSQVAAMVRRLLGLARAPAPDAADALAVALCGVRRLGLDGPGPAVAAGMRSVLVADGVGTMEVSPRIARSLDGKAVDLGRAFASRGSRSQAARERGAWARAVEQARLRRSR